MIPSAAPSTSNYARDTIQCLLQGTVKHCVSGGVVEVGQNDGVLLRQRRCRTGAEEVEATGDQDSDYEHGSGNQNLPELSANRYRNFGDLHGSR